MTLPVTIYYWHGLAGYASARKLAAADMIDGLKGITRDASVFDGHIEPCQRAVILSGVHPGFARRIEQSYRSAGVPVEHVEVVPDTEARDAADAKARADVALQETIKARNTVNALRKLPTSRIRALANERGVDISRARDRMAMIAALLQHQKGHLQ